MPLSYVVRYQAAPDHTTYFQGGFISEKIYFAPLSGAHFQADTRKVHQLLKNYLVDEMAEQWIRIIENRANGWDDFDVVCRHYSGEGNVSHRIATADFLQETLNYKSECAMSFNTILDITHKTFNIYRYEVEQMDDSTQVRKIFRRIKHLQLQDTAKALEIRADLDGITYS